MNLKICAVGLVATLVANIALSATTYTWQSDGTGYDGSFIDPAHWGGTVPGATSDQAGDIAQFERGVGSYTVTFPAGELTNYAAHQLRVGQGETVRFDGRQTTLSFPTGDYKNFIVSGAMPDGSAVTFLGGANLTAMSFVNFDATLSSDADGNNSFALNGGTYSFTGNLYPFAYGSSSAFTYDTGGSYKPGSVTIALTNATLTSGNWELGSVAPTNRLIVSGGSVETGSFNYNYWNAPNQPNNVKVLKELLYTDGAKVKNTAALSASLNQAGRLNSLNHTLRIRVEDGAEWQVHSISHTGPGRMEILVRDTGSLYQNYSQGASLGAGDNASGYLEVINGATAQPSKLITLGSATYPDTSWGELCVSNATLKIPNGSAVKVENGRVALLDGAVVEMTGGTASCNIYCSGSATREIFCDGARIDWSGAAVKTPIEGFSTIPLGPKGLTLAVLTYNAKDITGTYTDATTGGRLILKPYYDRPNWQQAMTITDAGSDESYLDIARGTVYLAAGANHNSFLTVTNNALFSLAGSGMATGATLKGLKLGDATAGGTLALDADDVITLSGPFDIANGSITYSSTLSDGAHTVFKMTTEPSADLVAYWESGARTSFTSGLDPAKYNIFSVEKSGSDWNFLITVYTTIPAKVGDAVWAGSGADWETAENWQGGQKPDGLYGARFDGAAPTTVTLTSAVTTAGLTFDSALGYTLTGGAINLAFNAGSAIDVSSGSHTVASGISNPFFATDITIADGAELTLSGPFSGVGINKTGDGTLCLTASGNRMTEGVKLQSGTLKAVPAALNYASDVTVSTLAGGTLELTGAGAATPNVKVTGSVEVRSDGTGSSLSAPSATAGSLNKRGADPFTLVVDRDREMKAALNVYEGELRVEGDGVHKLTGVGALSVYAKGLSAADAPDAGLVINDVKSLESNGDLLLGLSCQGENLSASPYVAVTNSFVAVQNVDVGDASSDASMRPVATFSNSTLRVLSSNGFRPGGQGAPAGVLTKWFFTDSRLELAYDQRRFRVEKAPYEMTFDHSTLCYYKNDVEGSIVMYLGGGWGTGHGEFLFKNGSRLCCQSIWYSTSTETGAYVNPQFRFTFDNSEWFVADKDWDVPSKNMNVLITAQGETGIIFAPPVDCTWTLYTPITGEGGLTKRGEGTLNVVAARKYSVPLDDPETLKLTGAINVEGGTMSIALGAITNFAGRSFTFANDATLDLNGLTLTNAVLSGQGALLNASLRNVVLDAVRAAEGTPLLDFANGGLSAAGRVTVRFNGIDESALGTEVAVARYTGTLPTGLSFRVKGWTTDGKPVSGTVRVADGVIYATPQVRGLMILVR